MNLRPHLEGATLNTVQLAIWSMRHTDPARFQFGTINTPLTPHEDFIQRIIVRAQRRPAANRKRRISNGS